MRAMTLSAAGQPLRPTETGEPPPPGPGQVLIRVAACGVCRTDLHIVDGELPQPKVPVIPGHEIVGRILVAHEDRPVEGVAVEAAEPRQPEEPRRAQQPHPADAHRPRVPVETVESRLRAHDLRVRHRPEVTPLSTRIAVPSPGSVW